MRIRSSIACLLLLLASGGAQAEWLKEGASADDLKRDQAECERKARADTDFTRPPPMGGSRPSSGMRASNTMVRENQSVQLCMKSKGYVDSSDRAPGGSGSPRE